MSERVALQPEGLPADVVWTGGAPGLDMTEGKERISPPLTMVGSAGSLNTQLVNAEVPLVELTVEGVEPVSENLLTVHNGAFFLCL